MNEKNFSKLKKQKDLLSGTKTKKKKGCGCGKKRKVIKKTAE
ncbi:hypothetical protein [Mesobacillus harenae]|nr:hypothetical protein [Mesobacillus harenae]